jgi:hypothetical protein
MKFSIIKSERSAALSYFESSGEATVDIDTVTLEGLKTLKTYDFLLDFGIEG